MAEKSGAKCVLKNRFQTTYDMLSIGVRNIEIVGYYNMPRSTVANFIRRYLNNREREAKKKLGRKLKLLGRVARLLQRYILQNCDESLHVIAARFNDTAGLSVSVWTVRRYKKRRKMSRYIAVQKPFLLKKNIAARILYRRTHAS